MNARAKGVWVRRRCGFATRPRSRKGANTFAFAPFPLKIAAFPHRRSGSRPPSAGSGLLWDLAAGFALAALKDLLAHFLRGGLDFLHLLADAGARGLVPAPGLVHVVFRLGDQSLQRLIFLHG